MNQNDPKETQIEKGDSSLGKYAGRWIARIGLRVVGQGGTPDQALYAAKSYRPKETPEIIYVPTMNPLSISDQIEHVARVLPGDQPVYLVGGAVRDALLGQITHDLDFVVARDSMEIARSVANALGAAYYPLDETRETARVVILDSKGQRQMVDFALLRGADLESDLRARDFTINAMAVEVREPERLLDPLSGLADLQAKRLRACSRSAFYDDPVRILRGIRLATAYEFQIVPETRQHMRQGVSGFSRVSPERIRDEIFKILEGNQPATSLWALDLIGAIPAVFPELGELKGISDSPDHRSNIWRQTLDRLKRLEMILGALRPVHDPDKTATFMLGMLSVQLGRYRDQISAHLSEHLVLDRSIRSLLFLAGMYHDVGKPEMMQTDPVGQEKYSEQASFSAELLQVRGRGLRLSNEEIAYASVIVRNQSRHLYLAGEGRPLSRQAVYRFFRDTGRAGVDVCILSLADLWANHGPTISQDIWVAHLEIVRTLLEAWYEHHGEMVNPERLVDGNELMEMYSLPSGPEIGQLLEAVREAQAVGDVNDREQALAFVSSLLERD